MPGLGANQPPTPDPATVEGGNVRETGKNHFLKSAFKNQELKLKLIPFQILTSFIANIIHLMDACFVPPKLFNILIHY